MSFGLRRSDLPGWTPVAMAIVVGIVIFVVRDILPPFIVGAVAAYLLTPVVAWIERYFRLSRLGAVLLLGLVTLSPLSALWFWFLPPLVRDAQALATAFPALTNTVFEQLFGKTTAQVGVAIPARDFAQYVVEIARDLLGAPEEPAAAARAALGLYANVFLALVILTYLLMDGDKLVRSALNFAAPEQRLRVRLVVNKVDHGVLPYAWGLVVMSALGLGILWLAFSLLYPMMPYALPVALAITLLGLVPFVGPFVGGAFAAFVALAHGSLELAVAVVVFYYLYRVFERQLLAPRLLDPAITPHPVVTIFAALSGAAIAGLFGALLAIPLAAILKVFAAGWQAAGAETEAPSSTEASEAR